MLFNFSDVVVKDLEGNQIPGDQIARVVANTIAQSIEDLSLTVHAYAIVQGKAVDLTSADVQQIANAVSANKNIFAIVRKAILDYIEETKKANEDKAKKNAE